MIAGNVRAGDVIAGDVRNRPDFSLEREIDGVVCGVDEAGRGPWAGPVVAGAAILVSARIPHDLLCDLDDSKKLKPQKREAILARLDGSRGVSLGLGQASVEEIDSVNILQATFLAMARAVEDLAKSFGRTPDFALIDGNRLPQEFPCRACAVIKGDGRSLSIAAASIYAKVMRDRLMVELDQQYPGYGWVRNAGYGTAQHQASLARLGITPVHRKSFAPIRKMLSLEPS